MLHYGIFTFFSKYKKKLDNLDDYILFVLKLYVSL